MAYFPAGRKGICPEGQASLIGHNAGSDGTGPSPDSVSQAATLDQHTSRGWDAEAVAGLCVAPAARWWIWPGPAGLAWRSPPARAGWSGSASLPRWHAKSYLSEEREMDIVALRSPCATSAGSVNHIHGPTAQHGYMS